MALLSDKKSCLAVVETVGVEPTAGVAVDAPGARCIQKLWSHQ
ncbi:hypothetical protein [Acinetobacter baumannii]|nr:hypothetical protein [Acinetobacter baumannii]